MSLALTKQEQELLTLGDQAELEAIAAFIVNYQSAKTRRVYLGALREFFACVGKRPADVTQSDVLRFREMLAQRDLADSTIALRLSVVSSLFKNLVTQGLISRNPVDGVQRPQPTSYAGARWLSKAQARRVLQQPDQETVKGKRDYAILLLMLLTGLRRGEVCPLLWGQFEQRGDGVFLRYRPKGGKERVREMPPTAWSAIVDYIDFSERDMQPDSPLFVATNEHAARLGHDVGGERNLGAETLRQIVGKYTAMALGDRMGPHSLRHTAATLLRESGENLEGVQTFLGHAHLTTTQRYLHAVEALEKEQGEMIARELGV